METLVERAVRLGVATATVGEMLDEIERARAQNERLREAIRKTLDENGHLADGENCTLILLKRAIEAAA